MLLPNAVNAYVPPEKLVGYVLSETSYVISGTLRTPRGTMVAVTTVWILETDTERPRFVTAFPREGR